MLLRTQGIVLRTQDFADADLIVTYLTLDFGIKKAFAKSPKKIKSRFGSSLEPLSHCRISLMGKEDAALPRLTQSDIIKSHQPLREDFHCFTYASSMAELTLNFLPEAVENRPAFELLDEFLGIMETGCTRLNSLLYKIRLLEAKGYAPRLSGCARCGASHGGVNRFFIEQGSIICPTCQPTLDGAKKSHNVTPGAIRLFDALSTWDIRKTSRLKASEQMLWELSDLVDSHIEHTIAKELKTRRYKGG